MYTDGLTYFIVLLSYLYRKTVIHNMYPYVQIFLRYKIIIKTEKPLTVIS